MPTLEFKARIPSLRLRPPNVRPDEGGPRLTIILDADCDQEDLDLNALRDRITTQDKKEIRVLLSWTNDDEKLKQAPMTGMVKCGPARRKGSWQCTDLPGEHLLSPCQHERDRENRQQKDELEAGFAECPPGPVDTPAPTPPSKPTGPTFCYAPSHPAAAHLETFMCIDPYKPQEAEYPIYLGDADKAQTDNPLPIFNTPACSYQPTIEGWTCRLTPEHSSEVPCNHITKDQLQWARSAGYTPPPTERDAFLDREAQKIAAESDRIQAADRAAEERRGEPTDKPRRIRQTTPA